MGYGLKRPSVPRRGAWNPPTKTVPMDGFSGPLLRTELCSTYQVEQTPLSPTVTFEPHSVGYESTSSEMKKPRLCRGFISEEVGFEPTVPCRTPVFKTGAIGRSATLPVNFKRLY